MLFLQFIVLVSVFYDSFGQSTNWQLCSEIEDEKRCLLNIIAKQSSTIAHLLQTKTDSCEDRQSYLSRTQPRDCKDWLNFGYEEDGVYTIKPPLLDQPLDVYCDMTTDGGGWTVIQRRVDGSENFVRNWTDYRKGFGTLIKEHWLGNQYIHALTEQAHQELRVDLMDWEGESVYAKYGYFTVASEQENFKLVVDSYSGTVSDAMSYSSGCGFTTQDRDTDNSRGNCATIYNSGGFWFNFCFHANLNGRYVHSSNAPSSGVGIMWKQWKDYSYSFKSSEMKIRPFH